MAGSRQPWTPDAVDRGEPDLVRRGFVDPRGRRWSYVRLLLPLGGTGVADRVATVIDRESCGRNVTA